MEIQHQQTANKCQQTFMIKAVFPHRHRDHSLPCNERAKSGPIRTQFKCGPLFHAPITLYVSDRRFRTVRLRQNGLILRVFQPELISSLFGGESASPNRIIHVKARRTCVAIFSRHSFVVFLLAIIRITLQQFSLKNEKHNKKTGENLANETNQISRRGETSKELVVDTLGVNNLKGLNALMRIPKSFFVSAQARRPSEKWNIFVGVSSQAFLLTHPVSALFKHLLMKACNHGLKSSGIPSRINRKLHQFEKK
jgi:hypothetical protein